MFLAGFASPVRAQDGPETDGNEIEIWTAGGHGTNGITQHTGVWTAGFRYGWVITEPRGPGFLRGRFEYAVDAVPVFVVFQPTNTAYGAAINPVGLIWNFDTHGRVVPYLDLDGGAAFYQHAGSAGNFQDQLHDAPARSACIFSRAKELGARTCASCTSQTRGWKALNPGINTVQLRLGWGWFTHPRH